MVEVEFLGPIDRENLRVDIKNLKDLKEHLKDDTELKKWLEVSAVAINDRIVSSLDESLKSGDKVSILPPVCGG